MTDLQTLRQHALEEQKKSFTKMLSESSNGEYRIPHLRMTTNSPEAFALQEVVSKLSYYFPEFQWSQSDSLNPNDMGLTIRWRRRIPIINPSTTILAKEIEA